MCRCAQNGSVEVMKFFYTSGLNFTVLNKNGHSALHKAAMKGNTEACAWLLSEEGPGLGLAHMLADQDGFTPSLFATVNGFTDLGQFLSLEYERMLNAQHDT